MTHPLEQFKFCPKCGSPRFHEHDFKSKECHDCGFVYYFNSSAATVAVIINENREVLVATRAFEPAKGTFDLPGGFVDMYETGEESVAREVKEETGMDVKKVKYLFSIPNLYVYSGFEVQTLDNFYLCETETSDFHAQDDVAKLQFVKLEDLEPEKFGLVSVRKGVEKIKNIII